MEKWRAHFPIFENKTYINSCSYGALSIEVAAAYQDYLESRFEHGADWGHWVQKNEDVRSLFATFVNASSEEVAILTSVSAGLNSIVSALSPKDGRSKIILSDFEFPTVGQIWQAQTPRGFEIAYARERDGHVPIEDYERLIDETTLAVSISHVCYRNGAMNDVKAITDLAHKHGAIVILDSSQAIGTVPVDVWDLGVDVLLASALKYMLGSGGIAYMFVRKALCEKLNPYTTGWFAQEDTPAMDMYHHVPSKSARRFESGTPPVPNLYAGEAALKLLLALGQGQITPHVEKLSDMIREGVEDIGGTVVTPKDPKYHGTMIAVRSTDDHKLVQKLAERNIVTSCRDGNLRVSPHFYNNSDDIEALCRALHEQRALLAS